MPGSPFPDAIPGYRGLPISIYNGQYPGLVPLGRLAGAGTYLDKAGNWTVPASSGGSGTVTSIASGTGLTGGPITVSGTLSLANTAVSAGSYTNANITVDAQGRLTAASNGSSSGGVTSITCGTGLSGGTITTSGTIALANTAVSAGSYTSANITVDAQGRLTAASNGSGGTSPLGFVYPETYGAVGNGTTDDTGAMNSAIAACTAGHVLILTQSYAISSGITFAGINVWSIWTSKIVPVSGSAGMANAITITQTNASRVVLGIVSGFTGNLIRLLDCRLLKFEAAVLQGSGTSGTGINCTSGGSGGANGTFDNDCYVGFYNFLNAALTFTNGSSTAGMQGNRFDSNFADNVKYGCVWDGSLNTDANEVTFGSWDAVSISGSSIWNNTNGTGLGFPVADWKLSVGNWSGGYSGTASIATGVNFVRCQFYMANGGGGSAWDYFNLGTGCSNNSVTGQYGSGSAGDAANWQVATNNRAAFKSAPSYNNSQWCLGTIGASVPAGGSTTIYVYSPFAKANIGDSYRWRTSGSVGGINLSAAQGSGLVCTQIFDNSATIANELITTWTNVSSTATNTSLVFGFYLHFCA